MTRAATDRRRAAERPGPRGSDLLALLPDDVPFAWVRGDAGRIGWGERAAIPMGTGATRFADAAAAWRAHCADAGNRHGEHPADTPVAFVAATFDEEVAGSELVIPRNVATLRDGAVVAGVPVPAPRPLPDAVRVRYAGSTVDEVAWMEAVVTATASIRRGDVRKVVLARDVSVWAEDALDVRVLARRLADRFPDCWTFVHRGLVGATPELLLRRRGRHLTSLVLAGSARRGADAEEDAGLGDALLRSDKDRREHALSVASVRDALAPLCRSLRVDPDPHLLRLYNVQHLATDVSGELVDDRTVLDVAGVLHPTAAVCGTPRRRALDLIRDLEGMARGRYAGVVGWVDARGDGELGIVLRCAEVDGRRARLFAGAGIVEGSLPERELEETRIKLRAVQSVLGGG